VLSITINLIYEIFKPFFFCKQQHDSNLFFLLKNWHRWLMIFFWIDFQFIREWIYCFFGSFHKFWSFNFEFLSICHYWVFYFEDSSLPHRYYCYSNLLSIFRKLLKSKLLPILIFIFTFNLTFIFIWSIVSILIFLLKIFKLW